MTDCGQDFFLGNIPLFFHIVTVFLHSFMITMLATKALIRNMKRWYKGGQPITKYLPDHASKRGTPSMGGIAILMGIIIPTIFWNPSSPVVLVGYGVLALFGCLGAYDDLSKLMQKRNAGISPRVKFFLQYLAAFLAVIAIVFTTPPHVNPYMIQIPFFPDMTLDSPIFYMFFSTFVIVATANAVNLTDGLDGLATRVTLPCFIFVAIIAFIISDTHLAQQFSLEYIFMARDVVTLAVGAIGALMGFLWYNKPKASIFMGDTGSMALGALLAFCFLLIRQELLLPIAGFVILMETLSVIIQITFIKLKNKKVFLFAPLHHHFEQKGWCESTIVERFSICSILCCVFASAIVLLHAYINAVPIE